MICLECSNRSQVSADFLKCFWPSIAGAIETALRKGAQKIEHFFEMLGNASSVQLTMSGKTYYFVHMQTIVKHDGICMFLVNCNKTINLQLAA